MKATSTYLVTSVHCLQRIGAGFCIAPVGSVDRKAPLQQEKRYCIMTKSGAFSAATLVLSLHRASVRGDEL